MSDEPPILPVGTAVSAKYKGAFCEAKVSRVSPQLRYRVSYKEPNNGTDTLKEEHVKSTGAIRVGKTIMAWHHGQKTFLEAQVTRIQDQSQYTVVFDDGDITTLRRNYLCLKSGRHFNESETLDQLPLTHPEHFCNPVVGGRSRRRNRNRGEDSDGEHEEADPEMEGYASEVGRVVMGENFEKKRNKDWPPGLIMLPKNPKMLNTKEEFLIRSFRDDRFYNVPKKDVTEFDRGMGEKLEKSNTPFYSGVQKALKYLNTGELPANWEKHSLSHSDRNETDTELNFSDSSDDEPCEEKDRFVAQLYKFLDEAGTPLNKTPTIGGGDVDLYRLFSVVNKLGGYNKVSNHNKWKTVTGRLKFGNSQSVMNQVKQVYKKCLLSFETFYKTLGVTMLTHTAIKTNKKSSNKGRSLIRDKDRATPIINSPKPPEKDEEPEKKEEEKTTIAPPPVEEKKKREIVKEKKKETSLDVSESSSSDATVETETKEAVVGRPKRIEKLKKPPKPPTVVEEGQQTRSKSLQMKQLDKKVEGKSKDKPVKVVKKNEEVPTKRALKRSQSDNPPIEPQINIGDKLKVFYGPSIESKITYEAKVVEIDKDGTEPIFLVHYTGWNTRYDEWIHSDRIAENLSASNKAAKQKLKQFASSNLKTSSLTSPSKVVTGGNSSVTPTSNMAGATTSANTLSAGRRKRNVSVTGKGNSKETEVSRSTTPLSSTSNSSRPKTPATPVTRSSTRSARNEQKRTRRTSVQTDTSVHTDTESAASESESESSIRTRSGSKNEENELRIAKKRISRLQNKKTKIKDDDDDTEKEEEQSEQRVKHMRKVKKIPTKVEEESDEEIVVNLPNKGRDFDLNQIRSELKGFSKVPDAADKDTSSDDSTKATVIKLHITAEEEDEENDDEFDEIVEKTSTIENVDRETKPPSCVDIYEFKEPEPFEFENRPTLNEDKTKKRLAMPRFFDEQIDKMKSLRKSPAAKSTIDEIDKKSPMKMDLDEGQEDDIMVKKEKEKDDPFDKLVESPSFNIVKVIENKTEVTPAKTTAPSVRESSETDDGSRDMELSDTESQTQIFSTNRPEEEIFTDTSSEPNLTKLSMSTPYGLEFPKIENKTVEEDDVIKASIQRVIEQTAASSTDDDTGDTLLQVTLPVTANYQKTEEKSSFNISVKKEEEIKKDVIEISKIVELSIPEEPDVKIEKAEGKIQEEKDEPITDIKAQIKLDEPKKRKKVISRPYIDSDTDSSDSDGLVIAKSDDDDDESPNGDADDDDCSRNNSITVIDEVSNKETIRNEPNEKRNFNFEKTEKDVAVDVKNDTGTGEDNDDDDDRMEIEEEVKEENEEPDSQLHSMLLCEETIPRSPAPPNEPTVEEPTKRSKSALEMPFASVPGSSNNKSIFFNNDPVRLRQPTSSENGRENSGVLMNTPPSTPESTLSNLSPREDHGNLSPDSREIVDTCNNDDYHQIKRNKMCLFSDDDSRMACEMTSKKDLVLPKKRRSSFRTNLPSPPAKRGRKPGGTNANIRSRHNSDSEEDTSDHSMTPSACNSRNGDISFNTSYNAERPLKYDFRANLDGMTDSNQRINHILQKMTDLRKVYMDVKVELANIERRRKKIKRRQREALKTMKQVVTCA